MAARWRPRRRGERALSAALVGALMAGCTGTSAGGLDPAEPPVTETPTTRASETPTTGSTLPPVPERLPPWVGATVPGGDASEIHAWEEEIGHRFDLVRRFARWDDVVAQSDLVDLLESGHRIHLSIRPVTQSGTVIPWRVLADSQPGDPRFGQLQAWVDLVIDLGPEVMVTINHEPETRESAANGTAADYVALWRRFAELVRERGGDDQVLVWTMTGGAFDDGRADEWYPGDDVVDVVGADLYNWWTCQGTDRPWRPMSELVAAPLAFADAHDKPLAIPEFASADDPADPSRRADWMADAADTLLGAEVAERLLFVAWFDVTAPGGTWPDCVWDHDLTPESTRAFGELVTAFVEH
ncbi:MAG: glycosyl hydrolase [Acidimicrobiales bacterium]